MPPEDTAKTDDAQQTRPTLRARLAALPSIARGLLAWAMAHKLRAAAMAGAAAVALGATVGVWLTFAPASNDDEPVSIEMALEALDAGSFAEARDLAKRLQTQGTLPPTELGGPVFVLGAAAAGEAADMPPKDAASYYLVAARYLEEARDRGFPRGRDDEGLFLLGKSLSQCGRAAASRPILLDALESSPSHATEIRRLLAHAYLNDANPQLERALAENGLYLTDESLSDDLRSEGLFQRAQILLRLGAIEECAAALEAIPAEAENHALAVLMRGQMLMHQAQSLQSEPPSPNDPTPRVAELYQEAIRTFRLAQGRDTLDAQVTRKSMYLIGDCFLQMADPQAALAQFVRIQALYPETPEALAANLREAELLLADGRNQEALTCFRRVLRRTTDPETFSNPWLSLDELRHRLAVARAHYLQVEDFESAVQLSRQFYPLFPRDEALQQTADAHRLWGEAELLQAAEMGADLTDSNDETVRFAREQFRHAGRAYWQLAELQIATSLYPDQIWNAANAFLAGHDFDNASRLFGQYVRDESRRQPRALVSLGETLLSLGKMDEAIEAFEQCIESHARDAAAFRARLLASEAFVEKDDMARAEALLRENLSEQLLAPASIEWRDSLFALGSLLHRLGRDAEAISCLEEYVQRYPEAAQALSARYLTADAYRRRGEAARDALRAELAESGEPALSRVIDDLFTRALSNYETVRDELIQRRENRPFRPEEASQLRNCHFAVGDVLVALRQYDEAIEAYRRITYRYQNRPEVLEAYVRMAWAHRCLNQPLEALAILEQAKVMLGRMPEDVSFLETTNLSRSQWGEQLNWLCTL